MNHSAVHQKLTQHYTSIKNTLKFKSKRKKKQTEKLEELYGPKEKSSQVKDIT